MNVPLKAVSLFTIILICASINLSQLVSLGPVSLQALLTIGYALLAWMLWFMRPVLIRPVIGSIWPFVLFILWTLMSLSWYRFTVSGFQNIILYSAFAGLILLTASLSYYDYKFQLRVGRMVGMATLIAAALCGGSALALGLGNEAVISPRAFAAAAVVGVAWYLSNWRYRSLKGLWWASVIILVMIVSLSRTASAVALLLIPISQLSLKNMGRWIQVALAATLVIVMSYLAITHIEPLQEHFFQGDTQLQLGGTKINVSGRQDFWRITLDSYRESPWIGHGAGSSEELLSRRTAGVITHPHNDYLRILHDYGAIGLGIWLLGFANLLWQTWKYWIMADRRQDPSAPLYLTAVLSLLAAALLMITDNIIIYINVMAPLGILVGAALGRKPAKI
jgi:O-antigen ligase